MELRNAEEEKEIEQKEESIEEPAAPVKKKQWIITQLLKNWKFLLIYGLSQIASTVYSVFIRFTKLGLGAMTAYGLSLLTCYILESCLGWNKFSRGKLRF